jgi:putative oxidoreductase
MKINFLTTIPRVLFGILAAYGGVLHFTMNVAVWNNTFLTSIYNTGYLWQIIGIINLLAGLLLLLNRFVPLALICLLPITFNILMYHIFYFTNDGLVIGIPMFVLNVLCLWQNKSLLISK